MSAADLSILGAAVAPSSIQQQAGALTPTEQNKQQFSLECIADTCRLERWLMGAARKNHRINIYSYPPHASGPIALI